MFTGIVTHRGRIASLEPAGTDGALRLCVAPEPALERVTVGDSVAVDGCCLTVTALRGGALSFDAIPETLRKTTLGDRRVGDRVNLEGALRMGDALGGHWVQGHVDGVGCVRAIETRGEDVRMVIGVPAALSGDVLPKGSITVDGVSLTVGEVWQEGAEERFSVYLIPHTLAVTGLGGKRVDERVNLEGDVLGRWVRHHLARMGPAGGDA
jgi:riboflavin synthase